jgi:hypothetical protein
VPSVLDTKKCVNLAPGSIQRLKRSAPYRLSRTVPPALLARADEVIE